MDTIVMKLRVLCDPLSEAMSDRARLDAFVKCGSEAADKIESLHQALNEIIYMAGMPIDIPPEDMLANAGATAMVALGRTEALEQDTP